MKIKIEGWLYAKPNEWNVSNPKIQFWEGADTKYWVAEGYIPLCAHTIEAESPEVDIVAGQVQCLLVKREKLTKEYEASTTKIDDALAKLKCLTFDEKGVAA
ncbi:hypothetical protein FHX57_006807 [Paraburkholderia tropica]|uniref:hypothetical protein n=1 Tax=Paraburkholderia tropica TaxID=92647 RepID=UPI00161A584D|nr:hypothetical protein [Paraburkholderia tropica]MBB3004425.1 hypothetical protein [Paraburkholderia tropica]